jgi:hypothetical protein
VPGVAAIFFDQVAHQAAQAGLGAIGPGVVDELVKAALSQGRAKPAAGALDGVVPERVKLLRRVVAGRGELPLVVAAVPAEANPRLAQRLPGQLGGELVVLADGEMLEQAAEG